MIYEHVRYPHYATFEDGAVIELRCKVCGVPIAHTQQLPITTRSDNEDKKKTIEVHTTRFVRLPTYTELKMQFENGSYHVTNGCNKCLVDTLTPTQLQELLMADVEMAKDGFHVRDVSRIALRVVAIRGASGIP